MHDKIYRVTGLHLFCLSMEAEETELSESEVLPEELFDIFDFKDYRIHLVNSKGKANIVDMGKWKDGKAL